MINIDAQRKKDLAIIHIAKSQLNMSDDTYHDMLKNICNVTSASDLNATQRRSLIGHLKTIGFKSNKPTSRKMHDSQQAKKIRHLWLELHVKGAIRNPSEAALTAYVQRQTGIQAMQWLSVQQGAAVIESLKKWLGRYHAR